jgi:ABC-type multidrug transport system fused ATPase/permease subunit
VRRQDLLERQVERLDRKISQLEFWSQRYSWSRLWVAMVGIVTVFVVNHFVGGFYPWVLIGVFFVLFFVVVRYHNKIEESLKRHRIYHQIKGQHVARLKLDWERIPNPHDVLVEETHPFEADLNLAGYQSLYQLLDTTTSSGGSELLRAWLLNQSPDQGIIQTRQKMVQELVPLLGLRDRLGLNGQLLDKEMDARWDGERIVGWLEMITPKTSLVPFVILLGFLAVLNIGFAALDVADVLWGYWKWTFPVYCLIYFGLYFSSKIENLGTLIDESYHLRQVLSPFRAVLLKLESYPFDKQPQLKTLCEPLRSRDIRPSEHLREVARIAVATRIKKDSLLHPILNAVVPWDLYFTHRLNGCKKKIKDHLPTWLDIWYEVEAVNALAHFGWSNPDAVMPSFRMDASFEGKGLGHPLIHRSERVNNDFTFGGEGEVVLVTGSNMSGKSTFLRTLGLNLCLAYAGGPVLASSLTIGLFRLFTCIKVSDSVTDGISYFYAEVKRLKALLAALEREHSLPLFFLIDEIFRGTNNRERLIGSRSFIKALTQRRGLGMVSTHDLELVHLEKEVSGIRNFHFRETIQDGKMVFDYLLQPGPCPTTNALTIMRLEGLPVDDSDS